MTKRRAWHYDAFEGRPEWSKELGRERAMLRQAENDRRASHTEMSRTRDKLKPTSVSAERQGELLLTGSTT